VENTLAHFNFSDEFVNRPRVGFWMEDVTMQCHVFLFTLSLDVGNLFFQLEPGISGIEPEIRSLFKNIR
jgi:hypothetical protein